MQKIHFSKVIFQTLGLLGATLNFTGSLSMHLIRPMITVDQVCENTITEPLSKCYQRNNAPPDKLKLFSDFDPNQSFTFPNDAEKNKLMVQFNCSAPFPVEWIHYQNQWLSSTYKYWIYTFQQTQHVGFHRRVKNFSDPTTYMYSAVVRTHYHEADVGLFTCQLAKAAQFDVKGNVPSARMTLFQELDLYENAFPMAGKNISIWLDETDQDGNIILPCYVYNPKINVTLYRKVTATGSASSSATSPDKIKISRKIPFSHIGKHKRDTLQKRRAPTIRTTTLAPLIETWEPIVITDGLTFRPEVGFIHQRSSIHVMESLKLVPGEYKCAVTARSEDYDFDDGPGYRDENNEDIIYFTFISGRKPKPVLIDEPVKPPATFLVEAAEKSVHVQCCSDTGAPPNMFLVRCVNKDDCERQRAHFPNLTWDHANLVSRADGNCRKSLELSRNWGYPLNIRCIGDGINVAKTLIDPVPQDTNTGSYSTANHTQQPYLSWDSVEPANMMSLLPTWKDPIYFNNTKLLVYKNVTFRLACAMSLAYFAEGNWVSVNYQNGSLIYLKVEDSNARFFIRTIVITLNSNSDDGSESISCYAPDMYSDKWTTKTIEFHWADDEPVTIIGGSSEQEAVWDLGDDKISIKCEFVSLHKTKVTWFKDDKVIQTNVDFQNRSNYNYHVITTKNTSILTLAKVNYESRGEYKCLVENSFATATKLFRVYVRPSETLWTIFAAFIGVTCFVLIVAVHGYRSWRTWRKIFQDVLTHGRAASRIQLRDGGFVRF